MPRALTTADDEAQRGDSVGAVAIWAVFLDRTMHEDTGRLFAVGERVSWDVVLVDGVAQDWPRDVLVDIDVRIDARPTFALHGSLATTPQLAACWRGIEPIGSEFRIRAGLCVDLFNPPFRSTATGSVTRIETVQRGMDQDARGVWNPVGPWHLTDVRRSPRWLARRELDPASEQDIGFLIELEVESCPIRPFPTRTAGAARRDQPG
ncbi:MAG: DUF6578 domain-containing protein [Solirubrobacteraceae bacterium]